MGRGYLRDIQRLQGGRDHFRWLVARDQKPAGAGQEQSRSGRSLGIEVDWWAGHFQPILGEGLAQDGLYFAKVVRIRRLGELRLAGGKQMFEEWGEGHGRSLDVVPDSPYANGVPSSTGLGVLTINGTEIEDTFAEAFPMTAARLIVTAANEQWALTAAREATGYAASVIGCDAEAGLEGTLTPEETPDCRPGVSILMFAFSRDALQKAAVNRVGQCILTCPTTACYNGLPVSDKRIRVGGNLRFFGDGWQASKLLEGRRYWRIPVMDGEFTCEDVFGTMKGVAGGNFLILAETQAIALAAAEAAVAAIGKVPGVILPFPGGIVRSGSKVGSKYKSLRASTNDAYCPTLRGAVASALPDGVNAVYELVIDGVDLESVAAATRAGVRAACRPGVRQISAGNYGGKLGPHHLRLHELLKTD